MFCTVLVGEYKDKYSTHITAEFLFLYLSLCLLFDIPSFLETQFLSWFQLHVQET